MPDTVTPITLVPGDLKTIEQYIQALSQEDINRYSAYWSTITPKTHDDYFKRWLFAFLSVHTSWRANVKAYVKIDREDGMSEKDKLMKLIVASRAGLHTRRTEGMWKFKNDFWANPEDWYRKDGENWAEFRKRLMDRCLGLGYAKTAFAIELCYPLDSEVACLDTHMLQLYGATSTPAPSASRYKELEKHWVDTCKKRGCPPPIARNIYWDNVQEEKDTRYWSYVFEKPITQI